MFNELFLQLAIILLVSSALALIAKQAKQPLILAYLITGAVLGPSVVAWSSDSNLFSTLAAFGTSLLLFIVGLNLNSRVFKEIGLGTILVAITQVLMLLGFSLGFAWIFDWSLSTAFWIGLALALSSTIVGVKYLDEQQGLDRLHGRITIGLLIAQDLIALIALIAVTSTQSAAISGDWNYLLGGLLALSAFLIARFIWPLLWRATASSGELQLLLCLTWCFGLAAATSLFGLGLEIGALFAGVLLASLGYQGVIEHKVKVLSTFFLIVFFTLLGSKVNPSAVLAAWPLVLALLGVTVILKTVVISVLLNLAGHHPRLNWQVAASLCHVSEFSYILIGLAAARGWADPDTVSLIAAVGLLSLAISHYWIKLVAWGYNKFHSTIGSTDQGLKQKTGLEVVLIGFDKLGEILLKTITHQGVVTVVDYNPEAVEKLGRSGLPVIYGDISEESFLKAIQIERAQLVISTVPDMGINSVLANYLESRRFSGDLVLTARVSAEAAAGYALGADFVIIPSILGGEAIGLLTKGKGFSKLNLKKLRKQYG